jgi:hypothetical protein
MKKMLLQPERCEDLFLRTYFSKDRAHAQNIGPDVGC